MISRPGVAFAGERFLNGASEEVAVALCTLLHGRRGNATSIHWTCQRLHSLHESSDVRCKVEGAPCNIR